jgi:hypothetical protein
MSEPLSDPYQELSDELKWRICADVSMKDHLLVKAVCPYRGIIQVMTNILFKAVVDECRQRGIIYYSEENYDKFADIIRRRAAPFVTQTKPEGHVPGGTGVVHPTAPHTPDVKPSATERTRKRRVERKGTCQIS